MFSDSEKWLALAAVVLTGWLLYLLAPVLTPFVIAGLLAYLGDPVCDRLQTRGLSRTLAVVVVFLVLLGAGLTLLLVMLPLLERQLEVLAVKLPQATEWLQAKVLPRVAAWLPGGALSFDAESLRTALSGHWQQIGGVFTRVLGNVFASGRAVLAWVAYLVLIPVVTFYLLRDWDAFVANLRMLLPRKYEPTVALLASECDAVLGEFLRGQLLVMLVLAVVYTGGLWLVGLELALLVGMLAGLVSFVPYLGVIVGVLAAGVAAAVQFQDVVHPLLVLLVFGIGQALEGMVLSPMLVGDRIGMHPVAVIFAVMAGGQLFGFFGVLLALPVAAIVVVLLRHARARYLGSQFYTP
jgi:predicted PurR-regulated permease PerM